MAAGKLGLAYDSRILREYDEVLRRPKFRLVSHRIDTLLNQIMAVGVPVAARPLSWSLPDPDDEMFVEVALAAGASHLVTGNRKHFPDPAPEGLQIVSPRELVDFLRALPSL